MFILLGMWGAFYITGVGRQYMISTKTKLNTIVTSLVIGLFVLSGLQSCSAQWICIPLPPPPPLPVPFNWCCPCPCQQYRPCQRPPQPKPQPKPEVKPEEPKCECKVVPLPPKPQCPWCNRCKQCQEPADITPIKGEEDPKEEVKEEPKKEEGIEADFPSKPEPSGGIDFPPLNEEDITPEKAQILEECELPVMTLADFPPEGTDQEVCVCFQKINKLRSDCGLEALRFDEDMCKIAQAHSNRMASFRSMFHSGCGYAENVAVGYVSGANTFQLWRNSQGHLQNMLRQGTKCGIARCGTHWTFIIGR